MCATPNESDAKLQPFKIKMNLHKLIKIYINLNLSENNPPPIPQGHPHMCK